MVSPFRKDGVLMKVKAAKSVDCAVHVPGSKSLTNRYLLLTALANGESEIRYPLESDDTVYMRRCLELVGVHVEAIQEGWQVQGRTQWKAPQEPLFVGNAGTVMRFFSPALAMDNINATITGNERMRVRPIRDLVDGLKQLQVNVKYLAEEGCPPLRIRGPIEPGNIEINGESSSQYLSGLLMVLPLLKGDSQVRIRGDLVSRTYVEMTLDCMSRLGVTVTADEAFRCFSIKGGQTYNTANINIEPDASTASYWFALPLMVGGKVFVSDVPDHSHQGDFGLLKIIEDMGAKISYRDGGVCVEAADLQGVDVDMNTMSDVAPTIAVIATKAKSPTTIRNIGNMRIKECDRIDTIQAAFDALGLKMESGPDWMKIYPGHPTQAATLNPEDDHRMAMIFALLGLAYGDIKIRDPECVAKTYPAFFEEFGDQLTCQD